ncbi:glycosyltransferase family 2 protein [Geodermatophilus sp. TF02-6]|uniref:glycosyltransferase n=1 Tax=Geodermatophilus sp. TF02-6 TaxID=2250575 RepID=UPI0018F3AE53|nr:glycosyltransferase [Geodermatophilus sp. TF02-6]
MSGVREPGVRELGVRELGVVVPARDEEELLPACLSALRVASADPALDDVRVRVVVVTDGCTDRTAQLARAGGAVVLDGGGPGGNVGAARDTGVRRLLTDAEAVGVPPEAVWVATTDADSTVPPEWLALHRAAAASGADALVGTVTVPDWTGVPPGAAAQFEAAYRAGRSRLERAASSPTHPAPAHPHVHGAHLGVRGSAYLAVGGFPAVRVGEDVALVRALDAAGATVLRTLAGPVRTSARRRPRAPGGFGSDIDRLVTGLDAG